MPNFFIVENAKIGLCTVVLVKLPISQIRVDFFQNIVANFCLFGKINLGGFLIGWVGYQTW